MNLIAKSCPAEDILLARDIPSKARLFDEAARRFEQRPGLPAREVVDSLKTREVLDFHSA